MIIGQKEKTSSTSKNQEVKPALLNKYDSNYQNGYTAFYKDKNEYFKFNNKYF